VSGCSQLKHSVKLSSLEHTNSTIRKAACMWAAKAGTSATWFTAARRVMLVSMAVVLLLAIFLLTVFSERSRQPMYAGKSVGDWFSELCFAGNSAADGNPELVQRAFAAKVAFSKMDSNAIPVLVKALRTPESKLRDKLILAAWRRHCLPVLFSRTTPSINRRLSAAYALSQMSERAISSLPALCAAYEKEPRDGFKFNYAVAMARIMHMPILSYMSDTHALDALVARARKYAIASGKDCSSRPDWRMREIEAPLLPSWGAQRPNQTAQPATR
jgi:hypothetical protein